MKDLIASHYIIDPTRVEYYWNSDDECTVQHRHEQSFNPHASGEVLLVSPLSRASLPDGTSLPMDKLFQYPEVREHIFGFQDEFHLVDKRYHLRDLAYYNVGRLKNRRIIDDLRQLLIDRAKRYYAATYESDELQHFSELVQSIVTKNDYGEAIHEHGSFHAVVKAAVGIFWATRSITNRGTWSSELKREVHSDSDAMKLKLCSLFSIIPPLRFVESSVGERLIYVEDANKGDVAYIGLDPNINEFLAEIQPLHNFANPLPIQPGDVIREPGFVFGPAGGRLWQAGFDLSLTTILSDFVHRPMEPNFDRMGLRIDRKEVELFQAHEEHAIQRGSYGDDSHRRVHLMSNMAGSNPIEMCAIDMKKKKQWPAMFSAVDGRSTYPATVTVSEGAFSLSTHAGLTSITLEAGHTYLLPHRHARAFAMLGMSAPSKAVVASARLMIPHL